MSQKKPSNPSNEEWRPIRNYEGLYEVSNLGKVRSTKTNRLKATRVGVNGYVYVLLWRDNKQKLCTVHRIVAYSFIPEIEGKPFIDHINTNRADNRAINLRWCTRKENNNNPVSIKKSSLSHKGHINSKESIEKWKESYQKWKQTEGYERVIQRRNEYNSRPVLQINNNGEIINEFPSVKSAGLTNKIRPNRISSVLTGHQKTAGGFLWKYKDQSIE